MSDPNYARNIENDDAYAEDDDREDRKMIELLDEIYGCDSFELLEKLTCGDSNLYTLPEKLFELVIAAYAYLTANSGGENSSEYQQRCRLESLGFKPGPMGYSIESEDCNIELYTYLEENYAPPSDEPDFEEDEPERVYYEYDNRELYIRTIGPTALIPCHRKLFGEEAAELYDKLEACKLQSQINNLAEEYLNA